MAKVIVTEDYLEDIASAIRYKNRTSNTYKPSGMANAIMAIGDTTLITKMVSENGIYDATDDDADGYSSVTVDVPNTYTNNDEGKVVSNGSLVAQTAMASDITHNGTFDTTLNNSITVDVEGGSTLITKTVSENGTYDASDDNVDGYSIVTVDVPDQLQTISRSEWNALSTSQKQSYGLVVIQDSSTGFKRGVLVNGADYRFLIASNSENVKCIASYDNFNPASTSWGDGSVPVEMASACSQYQSEEAVYFNALSASNSIGIDLGTRTSDFTVYMVAKGLSYASGDVIVAGSVYEWQSARMNVIFHRSGDMWLSSIWGYDANLIDTQGDYVAIAMRSGNMKASWFAYGATPRLNVSYSYHGTRFTFGSRGSIYSTDLAVKFVGYVDAAESDDVINENLAQLADLYGLT